MFKQILFISLLIGYTFAISYKAYLPNYTKWSQRKLSSNGKYELKVYYWNDSICYFTPSVTGKNELSCCIKNGTGKLNIYRSQHMEGLKWHHCLDIKKGAVFNDLSYYTAPDLHGEWYAECTTGTHIAVDKKTGVGAYCKAGASGCVTPYGWVSNKYIVKKMNCEMSPQ